MNQFVFGAGQFYGIETIDLAGNAVTYPTPVRFAGVQEVTLDIDFTVKEAYGQYQFPLAVGRGTSKLTGKAKTVAINAAMWNRLVLGETTSAQQYKFMTDEADSIPASPGPYTITVSKSADFNDDLGVRDPSTGESYTRVDATPNTGEYSVSAGVYTFASADAEKNVLISYRYTDDTAGVSWELNNNLIGSAVYFKGEFSHSFQGKTLTVVLNRCMGKKLSLIGTKLEDFQMNDFDFFAMADDYGKIGYVSLTAAG